MLKKIVSKNFSCNLFICFYNFKSYEQIIRRYVNDQLNWHGNDKFDRDRKNLVSNVIIFSI